MGLRVWGSGFSVQSTGFRVQRFGFEVQGLKSLELKVQGLEPGALILQLKVRKIPHLFLQSEPLLRSNLCQRCPAPLGKRWGWAIPWFWPGGPKLVRVRASV